MNRFIFVVLVGLAFSTLIKKSPTQSTTRPSPPGKIGATGGKGHAAKSPGTPVQTPSPAKPIQTSTQTSPKTDTTFAGFADSYKAEMAYLISNIKDLNTPQGKMLTDKLTIGLVSIDNTLRLINRDPSRQKELKPILQIQVRQFLITIDMVKDIISSQGNTAVTGNSNAAYGKGQTIIGDSNVLIGNQNAVVGNNNALIGNSSIISGNNNGMVGNNGMTVGLNNQVKANNSYVFSSDGMFTKDNSLVVGNFSIDLNNLKTNASTPLIVRK